METCFSVDSEILSEIMAEIKKGGKAFGALDVEFCPVMENFPVKTDDIYFSCKRPFSSSFYKIPWAQVDIETFDPPYRDEYHHKFWLKMNKDGEYAKTAAAVSTIEGRLCVMFDSSALPREILDKFYFLLGAYEIRQDIAFCYLSDDSQEKAKKWFDFTLDRYFSNSNPKLLERIGRMVREKINRVESRAVDGKFMDYSAIPIQSAALIVDYVENELKQRQMPSMSMSTASS